MNWFFFYKKSKRATSLHTLFVTNKQSLFHSYVCGLCGWWICCLPDWCKPLGGHHQTDPRRYTVPTRFCPAGSHSPELQLQNTRSQPSHTWSSANRGIHKLQTKHHISSEEPHAAREINKRLLNAELSHLSYRLIVASCKFREQTSSVRVDAIFNWTWMKTMDRRTVTRWWKTGYEKPKKLRGTNCTHMPESFSFVIINMKSTLTYVHNLYWHKSSIKS